MLRAGMFVLGVVCSHGLFLLLTISNFLGFRGAPRESNPFARQNPMAADLMVLGILCAFIVVLSMYRREKKISASFMYGMWLGVAASLAVILLR